MDIKVAIVVFAVILLGHLFLLFRSSLSLASVWLCGCARPRMTSWAERMHRRATTFSNVVTSCGHPNTVPYPRRLEKVKFGVPLDEVCKNDIPGPLLVSRPARLWF